MQAQTLPTDACASAPRVNCGWLPTQRPRNVKGAHHEIWQLEVSVSQPWQRIWRQQPWVRQWRGPQQLFK